MPVVVKSIKKKEVAPQLGRPASSHKQKVLNADNCDITKQIPLEELVTRIVALAQAMRERKFYDYQVEVSRAIATSVLLHDGAVLTALLARQVGKCLKKGTPVMLFSGKVVPVEQVKPGDLLMGDDSTPRKVLSTCVGRGQLYTVKPRAGYAEAYTVNDAHILSVIERKKGGNTVKRDISVNDYLALSKSLKENHISGYKVPVEFPNSSPIIDPYWFGLWLGDGNSRSTAITTGEPEVLSFLKQYALTLGGRLSIYHEKGNCVSAAIVKEGRQRTKSLLHSNLHSLGVIRNKRIPRHFLNNSRKVRLEVLAGLVDSDGHINKRGQIEITQTNKALAHDIQWLARSLGFRASIKEKKCQCQTGNVSSAWRVYIYGETWTIPVLVKRKKVAPFPLRENPLSYGFDLVKAEVGDYYGFVLDGNKRFLLGDFTVTHNTELVGATVAALCAILPSLAKQFLDDWKLNLTDERGVYRGFAHGFHAGIYAPRLDQSGIMFDRAKQSYESDTGKSVVSELGITVEENNGNTLRLSNGSRILCESASEQSKIEGASHHLLVCEECQDISDMKIRKSLHPMVASTMGTILKVGTSKPQKCDFYDAIRTNQRLELVTKKKYHFEFPYQIAEKYNSLYRRYIEQEKIRLGEFSDEFRTSYGCEWLFERGMFITQQQLFNFEVAHTGGAFSKLHLNGLPQPIFSHFSVVAGIDWGSSHDSTVVTLVAVNWNAPFQSFDEGNLRQMPTYKKHVIGWVEFVGDDYEYQYAQVSEYLLRVRKLSKVVMDSNTCGLPLFHRFQHFFNGSNVEVVPFNFQPKIKSDAYRSLYGDFCAKRITFPADERTRATIEYRKFIGQMLDLRKSYDKGLMKVAHPDEKGAHDDFPDSLAMAAFEAGKPPFLSSDIEFNTLGISLL